MSNNIKDNPSFQKFSRDLEGLELFHKLYKMASFFGIKNQEMDQLFKKLPSLREQFEDIAHTPDKFNRFFLSRGWVAYETMNLETMKSAVQLAELGNIDEAETTLINYHSPNSIELKVNMLWGIPAFRSRFELAEKAFKDYKEGRYHSCIPITLLIIDGAVNDIEGKGFFADGTNLTAWDSIAAHNSGLSELAKILGQTRKKTNVEPIYIPYRNGILHGRDLVYDNEVVAAKTWAALFAVRDWAQSVRDGKKTPPPEEEPKNLSQNLKEIKRSLNQIAENRREQAVIDVWRKRELMLGVDIPETGSIDDYPDKSPEKELCQFITNWRTRNYGQIAHQLLHYKKSSFSPKKVAGRMREIFHESEPTSFILEELIDQAPAITEITIILNYRKKTKDYSEEVKFRLVYSDDDYMPVVRGIERGNWKIVENFGFLQNN